MSQKVPGLQDAFLNRLRKKGGAVTLFLLNGVKLQGRIVSFDNFCIFLGRGRELQMVFKHAISTVMPGDPVNMFPGEKDASEEDGGDDISELESEQDQFE